MSGRLGMRFPDKLRIVKPIGEFLNARVQLPGAEVLLVPVRSSPRIAMFKVN
jgi:hypothetical protein